MSDIIIYEIARQRQADLIAEARRAAWIRAAARGRRRQQRRRGASAITDKAIAALQRLRTRTHHQAARAGLPVPANHSSAATPALCTPSPALRPDREA